MNRKMKRGPFRRIVFLLACIMAFGVFAPMTVSAQERDLSTAAASVVSDEYTIGAQTFVYPVGIKDTIYYTRNGVKVSGATFKSSNSGIFSITKKGNLTAKKTGTAKLYCYYGGKKVLTATVKVVKNRIQFNLSSGGRKTGYSSYDQAGNPADPTAVVKPVFMEYTGRKTFRVQYQISNKSGFGWGKVRRLRNLRVLTADGKPIVSFKIFTGSKGFSLPPGKTIKYTIKFTGNQVKRFVDLTRQNSMSWALDWYRE